MTPIREEIRFIHIGQPSFVRVDGNVFDSSQFWAVLLLPLVAIGGALGLRRHRDRLEGDVAYARVRRASKMAKRRLAKAKDRAKDGPREFYGAVAGALQGFLADKFNTSEAGLVRDDIARLGRERGLSDETLSRIEECLDECDRQRFAPSGAHSEKSDDVLARVAGLMADLERELS